MDEGNRIDKSGNLAAVAARTRTDARARYGCGVGRAAVRLPRP